MMDNSELMHALTDIGHRIELLKMAVAAQLDPGLYVRRRLLPVSAAAFTRWAESQGFTNIVSTEELHVTIVHSRVSIPWQSLSAHVVSGPPSMPLLHMVRGVERLGDKGAVVLLFRSTELHARWDKAVREGAMWAYVKYRPHVTITYDGGDVDLDKVVPFGGMLEFGPEVQGPIDDTWTEHLKVARGG